jgi:hypothetical protein
MKRTLSILSAALLAGAIALPAFAQAGTTSEASKPAAEAPATTEAKPAKPAKKMARNHHVLHTHKKKTTHKKMTEAKTKEPSAPPASK